MGSTSSLKRDPIKYIRDKVKSNYKKDSECFICGKKDSLEFHHYTTLTTLFHRWLKKEGHSIETVEEIEKVRDLFIEEYYDILTSPEETVTLCSYHHTGNGTGPGKGLHKIYGKAPLLGTASKQKRWALKQREKYYGMV